MTASATTSVTGCSPADFRDYDPTAGTRAEMDLAEGDFSSTPGSTATVAEVPVPQGDNSGFASEISSELPSGIASDPACGLTSDLWLYRDRTVGMLRRYLRLSIEVGRLPSLLGREFFRTRVTSYHAATFEDAVIFVHDVERSLEILDEFERKLIAKIVLQEYSQEEAGRLLGCGRRTAARRYAEALDRISEVFLKREILTRLPATKTESRETCQEGKTGESSATDSEQSKNNS